MVIETELPCYRKMGAAVIKMYYNKQKAYIVHCHKFKNF